MSDTMPQTPLPITPDNPIPPDTREIGDMPFAGGDDTRAYLRRCSVAVAHEIEKLGCTGAKFFGLAIDEIKELRLGLAGGGVGLPCFVRPDRFCLAHNTIGGLQKEQAQFYPEQAETISRPLTAKEAGQMAFTEAVRHSAKASDGVGDRIGAAAGMLSGWGDMPRGTELVEGNVEEPIDDTPVEPRLSVYRREPFVCSEHAALIWTCRFCVAQAVANGDLEPVLAIHRAENESAQTLGEGTFGVLASELEPELDRLLAAGANEVEVYVLAKTLKRRLA